MLVKDWPVLFLYDVTEGANLIVLFHYKTDEIKDGGMFYLIV